MPTYKNISEETQVVIDVGVVKPGEEVTTFEDVEINNDNFEKVSDKSRDRDKEIIAENKRAGVEYKETGKVGIDPVTPVPTKKGEDK